MRLKRVIITRMRLCVRSLFNFTLSKIKLLRFERGIQTYLVFYFERMDTAVTAVSILILPLTPNLLCIPWPGLGISS